MQFVADFKFRGNDAECERLYSNYKKAKGELVSYLMKEGVDLNMEFERKKKENGTASGN